MLGLAGSAMQVQGQVLKGSKPPATNEKITKSNAAAKTADSGKLTVKQETLRQQNLNGNAAKKAPGAKAVGQNTGTCRYSEGCNNQLTKGNQQITKGNQQITKGNQQITKGNQQITKGNQQITKGNQQITKGNQQLTPPPPGQVGNQQLTKGNQQITKGNQQITKGNQQITKGNQQITKGNQALTK
jgi:uncharacterized phage infection (PIP) family protein YhgE